MTFHSILFECTEDGGEKIALQVPDFFADCNLDQIVDAIIASREEYNLKPFFFTLLHRIDAVQYRQVIFRDLENETLFEQIKSFAHKMRTMRECLTQADKLYYKFQKERWFLDAVEIYCSAVHDLVQGLSLVNLKSRGFLAFREYMTDYVQSDHFTSLVAETEKLIADFSAVKYSLLIKGNSIQVRHYDSETDYSAEVEQTFDKFKQGAVKDYRVKFPAWLEMNHIEAGVLDLVAKLNPVLFSTLDEYCAKNEHYVDQTIGAFDREIQFYIAYLEFIGTLKRTGLKFCYPQMSATSKHVYAYEGFDLALADKLVAEHSSVVCNDFYLEDKERVLVITGPNQGGKTTFARTFGQLHYIASIGCPVPGREAQLFLFDHIFTHFEKEEDHSNLHGKLEDDLVRIHAILDHATSNSAIILNEIFTSTTVQDALFLGEKVLERIIELDSLCVFVTFLDELASLSETTVSMVSTVVPDNPAVRTFKIVRRHADGLAYALAIAEKYRLTYAALKERVER